MAKYHQHTIYKLKDGSRVAGVTTIVGVMSKDALVNWANRIGLEGIEVTKYVDDKADIGTLAHDMIISHLTGKKVNTDEYSKIQIGQAENACLSFFEWLKGHKVKVVLAETPLISEQHRFGGTEDILADVDGFLELIDIKTGSGIYPEHVTQVAGGYTILLEENGYHPARVRILNVPRTPNENWGELVVSEGQKQINRKLFLACLEVYNLRKLAKGETVYAKKHSA